MLLYLDFIHQLKNALSAGQGHNDGVDLIGDLTDGHIELPAQQQERGKTAKGQQIPLGGDGKIATHNSQNGVLDIA